MRKAAIYLLGLSSLYSAVNFASETTIKCINTISSHSNREKMIAGDFSANVHWSDIKLTNTSVGYGPAENRADEITIVDGTIYLSRPNSNAVTVRHKPHKAEGAAMLQVASPSKWVLSETLSEVNSFDDLNFELDILIEDNNCDDSAVVPFKIEGTASSVSWSMDTLPKNKTITSNNEKIIIVGIYNRNNKEKYFIVRGYNIHAHVVLPELNQAGHLHKISLMSDARVYLPEKDN